MNALNVSLDFLGLLLGIVSVVFVYSAYKYGPTLYSKPLARFFVGLLFFSLAFAIPPFHFIITTVYVEQFNFFHHFLLIISIAFFADGGRILLRAGR